MLVTESKDILTSIALLLVDDARSLARFGAVCTAWRDVLRDDEVVGRTLMKRRFGFDSTGPEAADATPAGRVFGPLLQHFLRLARTHVNELADPATSSVVWGTTPQYWSKVNRPAGGRALTAMNLRMVCWFEASSVWKGVTQGTYKVVWHVQFGALHELRAFMALKFDAQVEAARLVETGADVDAAHPCAPPAPGAAPYVGNNNAQHNACFATLRVTHGTPVATAAYQQGSSGSGGRQAPPRLEVAAPAPPPEVDLGVRPAGLFLSRLEQNQLLELAAAAQALGPHTWVDLEVGTFTVPPGVSMDVRARMYDTTGAWKQGCMLDTASLVPVDTGVALGDKAAAALDLDLTASPAQQQQQQEERPRGFTGTLQARVWGLALRLSQTLCPRSVPPPHPDQQ